MKFKTFSSVALFVLFFSGCTTSNDNNSLPPPKYFELTNPKTFLLDDAKPRFLPDAVDTNCGAIWEYMSVRNGRWLPAVMKSYEAPNTSAKQIDLKGTKDAYMSMYGGTADENWHFLIYNPKPPGLENSTPWAISSWNSSTGNLQLLDQQDSGPVPSISADKGYLAYTNFYRDDKNSDDLGVFLVKSDGTQEKKLIEPQSGAVSLAWPYAFVLKKNDLNTQASEVQNQFHIERINVVNGERLSIPGPSSGRATFAANKRNLFIGRPDGSIDVADLEGHVQEHFLIPNNQRIGMGNRLDNGFLFLGEDSKTNLSYSAILVTHNQTWRLIYLSRQLSNTANNVGQNIVGNGKCVYWIDERTKLPSPDQDKGDLFVRHVHHYGFIEQIISQAKPVATNSK